MSEDRLTLLQGELLEDQMELSFAELCRCCRVPGEQLIELVAEGVIHPSGDHPSRWRFEGRQLTRVRVVMRLQRDLGVNLAGAALALELLEEMDLLRQRLARMQD